MPDNYLTNILQLVYSVLSVIVKCLKLYREPLKLDRSLLLMVFMLDIDSNEIILITGDKHMATSITEELP